MKPFSVVVILTAVLLQITSADDIRSLLERVSRLNSTIISHITVEKPNGTRLEALQNTTNEVKQLGDALVDLKNKMHQIQNITYSPDVKGINEKFVFWAKNIVDDARNKANNTGIKHVENTVNEHKKLYQTELKSCARKAKREVERYKGRVQTRVKRMNTGIKILSGKVPKCLQDEQCNLISDRAELLKETVNDLNQDGADVMEYKFQEGSCVQDLLELFKKEITDIQKSIDNIVNNNLDIEKRDKLKEEEEDYYDQEYNTFNEVRGKVQEDNVQNGNQQDDLAEQGEEETKQEEDDQENKDEPY